MKRKVFISVSSLLKILNFGCFFRMLIFKYQREGNQRVLISDQILFKLYEDVLPQKLKKSHDYMIGFFEIIFP